MISIAIAASVLLPLQAVNARPTTDPSVCEAAAASQLEREWADFEFSTEQPGGPMWLAGRGCYAAAAKASREYLARGPLLGTRQLAITQLHLARNLAFSGDEKAASVAAAAARRSDQATDAPLDWNSYVQGLYGFLTRDRRLLDDSRARLSQRQGEGDRGNGANLSRLSICFERTYFDAMTDAACEAPTGEP